MWWELGAAYLWVALGFWLAGFGQLVRSARLTLRSPPRRAEAYWAALGALVGYTVGAIIWPMVLFAKVWLALRPLPPPLPTSEEDGP